VNLYLRVKGRRADGYHDLVTVMQPLRLADELLIRPAGTGVTLECDDPRVPLGEENLAVQAAMSFGREWGGRLGVHLRLRKRIPLAAGLGGGSSDAAGTLLGLNELWGRPMDAAALHRLARRLGADVPFFLLGGPAVGRGIGTELTPMALPPYWYLLLNPGLAVSTRWVYESLDLALLQAPDVEEWAPDKPERWVHNDLETVTLKHFPELRDLLDRLADLGARIQGMSGSGPTLFALFNSLDAAKGAAREMRREFPGWMAITQGLTGLPEDAGGENDTWMV
jgi:4-diphosphocytidyl-2-C-methyl-D-erythritol kinase